MDIQCISMYVFCPVGIIRFVSSIIIYIKTQYNKTVISMMVLEEQLAFLLMFLELIEIQSSSQYGSVSVQGSTLTTATWELLLTQTLCCLA